MRTINEALPPELLILILLICAKDYDGNYSHITHIASVCRLWREVINSNATFWKELSVEYAEDLNRLVIQRNSHGALHVRCTEAWATNVQRRRFLNLAATEVQRWESLDYEGPFPFEIFVLLNEKAPRLTTLRLRHTGRSIQMYGVLLDAPYEVGLRTVDLDRVSTMDWVTPRIQNLRSLRLRRINGALPSIRQLYFVLTNCLLLEELRIQDSSSPNDPDAKESWTPTALPHFVSLHLTGVSRALSDFLLPTIVAPACRQLKLFGVPASSFSHATGLLSTFDNTFDRFDIAVYPDDRPAQAIVQSRHNTLDQSWDNPSVHLRLFLSSPWHELITIIKTIRPVTLKLSLGRDTFPRTAGADGDFGFTPPWPSSISPDVVAVLNYVNTLEVYDDAALLFLTGTWLENPETLLPRLTTLVVQDHSDRVQQASLVLLLTSSRWAGGRTLRRILLPWRLYSYVRSQPPILQDVIRGIEVRNVALSTY